LTLYGSTVNILEADIVHTLWIPAEPTSLSCLAH